MTRKLMYLLLLAFVPTFLMAQTVQPKQAEAKQAEAKAPNYLDEMTKMDAYIAYIQKQQELAVAQSKLNDSAALPRLVSISVDSKGGVAKIIYESGFVRWVSVGDILPDGYKVLAIKRDSVQIGGKDGKFNLAFAAKNEAGQSITTYRSPPNINTSSGVPQQRASPEVYAPYGVTKSGRVRKHPRPLRCSVSGNSATCW